MRQSCAVAHAQRPANSVNLRYSCHDSLSWRRFSFRGDDSLFAATILFSRRRFSFRGDDCLFVATILFSRRRLATNRGYANDVTRDVYFRTRHFGWQKELLCAVGCVNLRHLVSRARLSRGGRESGHTRIVKLCSVS